MHGWLREMQSVLADGDSRSLPELAYIVICCLKVTCFSYPFSDVWFLSGLQTDEGKCINLQKIKQLALCLWASTKFWKTPKYWVLVFYQIAYCFVVYSVCKVAEKDVHPRKK